MAPVSQRSRVVLACTAGIPEIAKMATFETKMPRQRDKRGARDAPGPSYAQGWATGNYGQTQQAEDGEDNGNEEVHHASTSGRVSVRLAMWDLGQCDRKRRVFDTSQRMQQHAASLTPKPLCCMGCGRMGMAYGAGYDAAEACV